MKVVSLVKVVVLLLAGYLLQNSFVLKDLKQLHSNCHSNEKYKIFSVNYRTSAVLTVLMTKTVPRLISKMGPRTFAGDLSAENRRFYYHTLRTPSQADFMRIGFDLAGYNKWIGYRGYTLAGATAGFKMYGL